MNKQQKIQLLKNIAAGKITIKQTLPEKWMAIHVDPDGLRYLDGIYTREEIDNIIKENEKEFNLGVIWVQRGDRNENVEGARLLTLDLNA